MERNDVEARQLLRQRKRQRGRQSCVPCRTRKVRCDKCSPCSRCSKSGYPDLCSYDTRRCTPPTDSLPQTGGPQLSKPPVGSGHEITPTENGESPYLGVNALPNLVRDHAIREDARRGVENAFMPIMGLGMHASSYPFMSPAEANQNNIVHDLYQALPPDRHIVRLFQCYLEEIHPFSPVLPEIEKFEVELCQFIEARALARQEQQQQQSSGEQSSQYQASVSWLGLLFAILSSGEQLSGGDVTQRREKSQLYGRYAFHCLRLVNFLMRPTVLCIQTLLVLGQVLQNDTRPEVAWILLGTTVRMAQSLGLHRVHDPTSFGRLLWSALVRQDSLLSLCYDRPPVTMPSPNLLTPPGPLSYTVTMDFLCSILLSSGSIGNTYESARLDFAKITTLVKSIEDIRQRHSNRNSTPSSPASIRRRCEELLLSLHTSFMVAWLCRPALRSRPRPNLDLDPTSTESLRETCSNNLLECVKSFVKLNTLTTYAVRSWAIVHNGLSSALLLGLLGNGYRYADVRRWQKEILDIFSGEQGEDDAVTHNTYDSMNLSAPHTRAIAELKKIYERGDPRPGQLPSSGDPTKQGDARADTSGVDLVTHTFESERLSYSALQPQQALQQAELSPLDLFDDILWDPVDASQFTSQNDMNWFESMTF